MISGRTLLGLVAFVFGIAGLFVPEVAEALPISPDFVGVVGVVLIVTGFLVALGTDKPEKPSFPVRETRKDIPGAGTEFDRKLAKLEAGAADQFFDDRRAEIHEDLRTTLYSLASVSIRERYGVTAAEAEEILLYGVWTDDEQAASFLSPQVTDTSSRSWVGRLTPFRREETESPARRVVEEIYELERGESGPNREELFEQIEQSDEQGDGSTRDRRGEHE